MHKRRGKIRSRAGRSRVSAKISKLRHEGDRQDQAVAKALSMERAGRLTEGGGYRRVGRKRTRKKSSRSRTSRAYTR